MNQWMRVAIGMGSNLGDRVAMLSKAAQTMATDFLSEFRCSSVYETEPVGLTSQPLFLNAVVTGITEWKPPAILNYLKTLERDLGRVPGERNGPRLIDLDLLAFGEQKWDSDGVEVPHPRLEVRDFVLVPFAEVWPDWVHPVSGRTIEDLCSHLPKRTAQFVGGLVMRG